MHVLLSRSMGGIFHFHSLFNIAIIKPKVEWKAPDAPRSKYESIHGVCGIMNSNQDREPPQNCCLGTVSNKLLGDLN